MELIEHPLGKLALSILLLAALAPIVMRFFRDTWIALDADAVQMKQGLAAAGKIDYRAPLTFVLGALAIALIHYYGDHDTFDELILPMLKRWQAEGKPIDVGTFGDLYWRIFWGITRFVGYLLPLAVWRLFFKDNLLDFGLRGRGFIEHLWIYVLCIVVIVPTLVAAASFSDFSRSYPLYKTAWRSWLDFAVWEMIYISQFFVLEVFFRGWWLRGARSLGTGAIFSMMVPYVMIHWAKPYLESCGAIVAGVVLGSLAMRTRSIYAGFLVHSTVAILMDLVSLEHKGQLPTRLSPTSSARVVFPYLAHVIWAVWALAFGYLLWFLWQRRRRAALPAPSARRGNRRR